MHTYYVEHVILEKAVDCELHTWGSFAINLLGDYYRQIISSS